MSLRALLLVPFLLGACGREPVSTGPEPHPARDPILFVHGWNGDRTHWGGMMQRFRAAGWSERELHAWTYESTRSNVEIAQTIRLKVDSIVTATGASRVDIVTHSMGSLSSRYYIARLGGAERVDAWVSLAGPNHGTSLAIFCLGGPCSEMRPGSEFLTRLNEGDETPGSVRYATWWSRCDGAIEPPQSVRLEGAQNTQTACLRHDELLTDPLVFTEVKAFVSGAQVVRDGTSAGGIRFAAGASSH